MTATGRSRWVLAVDYGTATTAAAVIDPGQSPPVLLPLGGMRPGTFPSAVSLLTNADGTWSWATGPEAEDLGRRDPVRHERMPAARITEGRIALAGHTVPVRDAVAATLTRVFREASRVREDSVPASVVLVRPTDPEGLWRETLYEAALRAAAGMADWPAPTVLPWALAVAHEYEREADHADPVGPAGRIAVLDIGASHTQVAVVDRFRDLMEISGVERSSAAASGERFDDLLLPAVLAAAPAGTAQRQELRRSIRLARESLTSMPSAAVQLPSRTAPDRPQAQPLLLHRDATAALLSDPAAGAPITAAARLLAAGISDAAPGPASPAVVIVGGCARTPTLDAVVAAHVGVVPVIPGNPQTAAAAGAALAARRGVPAWTPPRDVPDVVSPALTAATVAAGISMLAATLAHATATVLAPRSTVLADVQVLRVAAPAVPVSLLVTWLLVTVWLDRVNVAMDSVPSIRARGRRPRRAWRWTCWLVPVVHLWAPWQVVSATTEAAGRRDLPVTRWWVAVLAWAALTATSLLTTGAVDDLAVIGAVAAVSVAVVSWWTIVTGMASVLGRLVGAGRAAG